MRQRRPPCLVVHGLSKAFYEARSIRTAEVIKTDTVGVQALLVQLISGHSTVGHQPENVAVLLSGKPSVSVALIGTSVAVLASSVSGLLLSGTLGILVAVSVAIKT